MNSLLNILDLCEQGTRQLGPGLRFVIWVQGCPFDCFKCSTPEGIPLKINKLVAIESLANSIINNSQIHGITISGGEPFLQASKLVVLLDIVKSVRPELNTVVYTGFKMEELNWPEARDFIGRIDVLIDGKYINSKNNNRGIRGSLNQKIHFISNKLAGYENYFENGIRGLDIFIRSDHIQEVGIPNFDINF